MLTKRIKLLMFLGVDFLFTLLPVRAVTRNVAIIRMDAIGDFVLWLDAAQALVKPIKQLNQPVTLLANPLWANLASDLNIFDEVIPIDRKRFERSFAYHLKVSRLLRNKGFCTAIHPTYSRDIFSDSILRLTQAPERIGSTGDTSNLPTWQKRITDGWYTRLIPSSKAPLMELRRNAEFLRSLGNTQYLARVADMRQLTLEPIQKQLQEAIPKDCPYFILFPGASWKGRYWPIENFAKIAEQIYTKTKWHGVVCGSPDDVSLATILCKITTAPLVNWAGQTSLKQLTAVIANASLLLANETMAIHLGAATGISTICILGGGHFGRFLPYDTEIKDSRPHPEAVIHSMPCFGCNWQCIYERTAEAPVQCIENISCDSVWKVVSAAIDSNQQLILPA